MRLIECTHCDKRGHRDEFAYCLTCGSYVCPNCMTHHEKSFSHVVSWSLSKRYNWKATVEHLKKTKEPVGDKYDKLDSEAPNSYNPAPSLFRE